MTIAEMTVPDVVDMAGGMQALIAVLGSAVLMVVGGALAFAAVKLCLRWARNATDYSDRDYAYDRWTHAQEQMKLSEGTGEQHEFWMREEAYWHDQL